MLFGLHMVLLLLTGLLLYNTVVANAQLRDEVSQAVCSFTYSQKDKIKAISLLYQQKGYLKCDYHIRAPRNNFIELNFTSFFGFRYHQSSMTSGNLKTSRSSDTDSDTCLPPEVVLKESYNSDEQIRRICNNSNSLLVGPKIFHTTQNVLKLTYTWVENHSSGFTVDFDFHQNKKSCGHICDESSVCLSPSQVCNGVYECRDHTDEHSCLPLSNISNTAASHSTTDVDLIKALAVVISVVLMPGLFIIICVVSPCRLRSRMLPRRRRSREGLEHSQLRPDSQLSEVVYVPTPASPSTTSQDKLISQQISQVREHRLRVRSVQTDTMLDLPPQIPISKDGEETYSVSQKHLIYNKHNRQCLDIFRPPPNKTVHDRESPPPYYSNSASLENLEYPQTRFVRDSNGCHTRRCNSMSSNVSSSNGHKSVSQKHTQTKTHTTMSTNLASGRTRTMSVSGTNREHLDEPPDYPGYTSAVRHISPQVDNNV